MSFDWNWFFSSFCQSAAALLGIIAAFIISKLLGLNEKINVSISGLETLVIDYTRITSSLSNRYFNWYIERTMENDDDFVKAIENGEYEKLTPDEVLLKIYGDGVSPYKNKDTVLKVFSEIYSKHNPRDKTRSPRLNIPSPNLNLQLVEEKEKINALEVEAKTLIALFIQNEKDLKSFVNTIQPLQYIIIALMVSFPLTVIYPLHFMPVILNEDPVVIFNIAIIFKSMFSLKFLLLTIFFFSIEGIFYYFFRQTKSIQKILNVAIIRNSADYKSIESYSKYL